MAGIYNYNWSQGEDLVISLTYKTGPAGSETAVDLTGYTAHMTIASGGNTVFTAQSDGSNPAVVLNKDASGTTANGAIRITIPRNATLVAGTGTKSVFDLLSAGVNVFDYDIFLRDAGGTQSKILKGQIYVDKSVTLWQ